MKLTATLLLIVCSVSLIAQAHCEDARFDAQVRKYLKGSVPVVDVDTLRSEMERYVILDARTSEEYAVSHLPGALHVGFKQLNQPLLDSLSRDTRVVVYCSIGYRSEIVGGKLQRMGFNNVHNLFGSIFEWVNRGYPVETKGVETDTVHGYSRSWSKWILNPRISKVW